VNDVHWCADGTEAVQLPWPTDDAPAFDAYWLQDMAESFDPTATEPPGAEVGPCYFRSADTLSCMPRFPCQLHNLAFPSCKQRMPRFVRRP